MSKTNASKTHAEVRQVVIEAMKEQFPHFKGEVTDLTSARNVPGWDSLAHVDLILLIEEKLDRKIDVASTFRLKNIDELIGYLQDAL